VARKTVKFDVNPLLGGPSLLSRTRLGSPYRELVIDEIDVDPDQPRRVFDSDKLQELADSIKEHGIISPILVRALEGGTYRLISGERRLRAAKLAGLDIIPAVVDQAENEDDVSRLSKQLVENIQRSDLSCMERAIAIGQLKDTLKCSIRQIATKLGISKAFVQRSLEILELPDDLQAALINGASESKILALASISNRELRAEFVAQLDNFTRSQLEEEVKRINSLLEGKQDEPYHGGTKPTLKRKKTKLSAEEERLINEIQKCIGTKVELVKRKGKKDQGKVVIDFYTQQDLSEIYRRLTANV
jgi:ParB family transcriptional regulator, chromosome partitioning protein